MKKILMAALAVAMFAACGGGEKNTNPAGDGQIALANPADEEQTAWADDEESGVTFTAKSTWEAAVTAPTRTSNVSWVKLFVNGEEKYSGGAGTINLVIVMEPNLTNSDRRATVTITCGGENIGIDIEQKGVTEQNEPLTMQGLIRSHPWKLVEHYYFYPDSFDDPDTEEDDRYSEDPTLIGSTITFNANGLATSQNAGAGIPYEIDGNVLRLTQTVPGSAEPFVREFVISKYSSAAFEGMATHTGVKDDINISIKIKQPGTTRAEAETYTYYETMSFVKP
jgi:hypothetical protein